MSATFFWGCCFFPAAFFPAVVDTNGGMGNGVPAKDAARVLLSQTCSLKASFFSCQYCRPLLDTINKTRERKKGPPSRMPKVERAEVQPVVRG